MRKKAARASALRQKRRGATSDSSEVGAGENNEEGKIVSSKILNPMKKSTPFHTATYAPEGAYDVDEEQRKIVAQKNQDPQNESNDELDSEDDESVEKKAMPPRFHRWQEVFPFLKKLCEYETFQTLVQEMKKATNWHAWPEALYDRRKGEEWKVFPLGNRLFISNSFLWVKMKNNFLKI